MTIICTVQLFLQSKTHLFLYLRKAFSGERTTCSYQNRAQNGFRGVEGFVVLYRSLCCKIEVKVVQLLLPLYGVLLFGMFATASLPKLLPLPAGQVPLFTLTAKIC